LLFKVLCTQYRTKVSDCQVPKPVVLLTLTGPGGVGKTRLAVEVGLAVTDGFVRGATFISLQPVESADHLISTIADTLAIPLSDQREPKLQLLDYLCDKGMLLVLDDFKDPLDGTQFVALLLQKATAVKLLVTSRQALNLEQEWLYPVAGIPFPQTGDIDDGSA